jgi:hypothetical protein
MCKSVSRWLWVALVMGLGVADAAYGQNRRTVTMSRQVENEQSVEVNVQYGAGRFSVGPAQAGVLYHMQLEYDEDVFEPIAEYRGSSLTIGTEGLGRRVRLGRDQTAGEMELALSTDVAMDLDMDFGAVRADIDLGGISLTRLEIATGASETLIDISEPNREAMSRASIDVGAAEFTVRNLGNLNAQVIEIDAGVGDIELGFGGDWQQNARVSVDMGLGSLVLRFPRGLGVQLEKDTFLTSLDSEGLVKNGDTYYSLDYDESEYQITVDIDAAFGSIRVEWMD